MSTWYTPPDDQRAEGHLHGLKGLDRYCISEPRYPYRPNFSGHAADPQCPITPAARHAYYIDGHGYTTTGGHQTPGPDPADLAWLRDIGFPISGDETARAIKTGYQRRYRPPHLRDVWARIGLGPDGLPQRPAEPMQTTIYDFLEAT